MDLGQAGVIGTVVVFAAVGMYVDTMMNKVYYFLDGDLHVTTWWRFRRLACSLHKPLAFMRLEEETPDYRIELYSVGVAWERGIRWLRRWEVFGWAEPGRLCVIAGDPNYDGAEWRDQNLAEALRIVYRSEIGSPPSSR